MLEVSRLSKSFAGKEALRDVSLRIAEGECFGIMGPNGAGKTTLVNLISGFIQPDSGEIVLFGEKLPAASAAVKRKIGVVPQEIALYDRLSVSDNLTYFGELYGLEGKALSERIDQLLDWVQLSERKKDKVQVLSGGMKRRINLIAGLLHAPRLLLVDEPTVGIDPQARIFIYSLIQKLKDEGLAILYTTHYIPEVERLCSRAAILDEGRIVACGGKEALLAQAGIAEQLEILVDGDAPRWIQPISEIFEDKGSTTDGQSVIVPAPKSWRSLSEAIQKMDRAGIPVSGIQFNSGGLESAFFRLTGKELRE